MIDVAALGELLIDFTSIGNDERGFPRLSAHPGGAPANFLAALAKLGAKTAFLGKVGADRFGRLLIKTLGELGIETKGILVDHRVFTTLAFVTLDENGERSFSFARKPGADTRLLTEELELSLIDEARVFHFGSLSLSHEPARSATRYAVDYAKNQGKLISYDPNLRPALWESLEEAREHMLWGLNKADIVKISDEEVDFLFGMDPAEGSRHIIENCGASLVFVTCGPKGCFYRNVHAKGSVPAPKVEAIDTTGAGDIFGGSALWKLLQLGKAPEELGETELRDIALFACEKASLSTTHPGGMI